LPADLPFRSARCSAQCPGHFFPFKRLGLDNYRNDCDRSPDCGEKYYKDIFHAAKIQSAMDVLMDFAAKTVIPVASRSTSNHSFIMMTNCRPAQ
jgi:hypothetical protein